VVANGCVACAAACCNCLLSSQGRVPRLLETECMVGCVCWHTYVSCSSCNSLHSSVEDRVLVPEDCPRVVVPVL
jgi:hypothetical protein